MTDEHSYSSNIPTSTDKTENLEMKEKQVYSLLEFKDSSVCRLIDRQLSDLSSPNRSVLYNKDPMYLSSRNIFYDTNIELSIECPVLLNVL